MKARSSYHHPHNLSDKSHIWVIREINYQNHQTRTSRKKNNNNRRDLIYVSLLPFEIFGALYVTDRKEAIESAERPLLSVPTTSPSAISSYNTSHVSNSENLISNWKTFWVASQTCNLLTSYDSSSGSTSSHVSWKTKEHLCDQHNLKHKVT